MREKFILLTLLSLLCISVTASAVDLKLKDVTIEEALAALNKAGNYSIAVSPDEVDLKQIVSVNAKDASIKDVLDQIFKGQDVNYSINGQRISIVKKASNPSSTKIGIVTGTVVDAAGLPIIGAGVVESGAKTVNGVLTDSEGKFSINVQPGASLQISCLGYQTSEVKVGDKTNISVVLREDAELLSDVVVVGYGTQKKVDLTGSLSTVDADKLAARPVTNVSQALAGLAAGVSVASVNNTPGSDDATITVRGIGTLNSTSPMIIVDGAETMSLNSVLPGDIETMTVLKDAASSAIYGSRAANGVILITTKKGKAGQIHASYDGYVAWESKSTDNIHFVTNSADYMEYVNEGLINSGSSALHTDAIIKDFRENSAKYPYVYANSDVLDAAFKTGFNHNHRVSLSGGSEKIRFYGSVGYDNREGIMPNTGYRKFSSRINADADITSWLTLGLSANGYVGNADMGQEKISASYNYLTSTSPTVLFKAPNGELGYITSEADPYQSATNSPLVVLNQYNGYNQSKHLNSHFYATIKPVEGLTINANYTYSFLDQEIKKTPNWCSLYLWDKQGNKTLAYTNKSRDYVDQSQYETVRTNGDVTVRYEHRFADRLDFSIMAGYSEESYKYHWFQAIKYDLADPSLTELDAASADPNAKGNSTEWAMRSVFGRLNLGFDDKYLLEVNVRGDGSSRFSSSNRWGVFPSASLGWRLSQEKFMQNFMKSISMNSLKLRASYGVLGNNAVGNYSYISTYTSANKYTNYGFNDTFVQGIAVTELANSDITWEKTNIFDAGLDFSFFNTRFSGTIDYYYKYTSDILMIIPAPDVHGTATLPTSNYGEMSNRGVELTLSWQDKIGDFSYGISGNITWNKNRVEKYKGASESAITSGLTDANLVWEGHAYNSQYGYQVDRIIQTESDMKIVTDMLNNNPKAFATTGTPTYGDYLYRDINNDGKVDASDRTILSDGPSPKFFGGMSFFLGWKGLDFSLTMQGQAGASIYWQEQHINTSTVRAGYQVNKNLAENCWREGVTNAKYPRLTSNTYSQNTQICDAYLENLAFLKIRNIQLGYTLPKNWTKGVLEKVRIYGSLENFFTFTKFHGFDPETVELAYPTSKSAVIGLNLTF